MMYVEIDEKGNSKVLTETPAKALECKLSGIADRVKEELEDFLKYKHLNEESQKTAKPNRYSNVALQEFMHYLLALDDMFIALIPHLTEDEKNQFKRFVSEIKV